MIGWLKRVWHWFCSRPRGTDARSDVESKPASTPEQKPKGQVRIEAGYGPKKKCYVCGNEYRRWARKGPFGGVGPIMFRLPHDLWICRRCRARSLVVGEFRSAVKKEARRIRDGGR